MTLPQIDKLVRSKRKTIALIIRPDGTLEVRAPLRLPKKDILEWVASKREWIEKHRQEVLKKQAEKTKPANRSLQDGDLIYILGRSYPLRIIESRNSTLRLETTYLVMSSDLLANAAMALQNFLSNHLNLTLSLRLPYFTDLIGKAPPKVRLSKARTRWGSCSTRVTSPSIGGWLWLRWKL